MCGMGVQLGELHGWHRSGGIGVPNDQHCLHFIVYGIKTSQNLIDKAVGHLLDMFNLFSKVCNRK